MMKRLFSRAIAIGALALGIPALVSVPVTPVHAAQRGDLDRAVQALRAVSTMRADFTQFGRGGQRLTGVMTLKRPGKIRFQYQKDVPVLIVSDGYRLTMIDYEVRQKQVWPVKNSPLGALLDPGADIARFGTLMPTEHPDVVSIRVRDPKHPEYGTMTLIFRRNASTPGGLELGSWVAIDAQNKVTRVVLENQRYGIPVSDNLFRYRDVESRSKR